MDSLSAAPLLAAQGARRILDLGSGGGFPGLPLAAALDADRTLLVESIGKKAAFLRTAAAAVAAADRVAVEAERAEALARRPEHRGAWDAVTARAVGTLAELIELGMPFLAPGGALVAWKRAPLDDELAAAGPALAALCAGPAAVHEVHAPGLEDHRLVVIPRGGPVDRRYPRDPAERRRRAP